MMTCERVGGHTATPFDKTPQTPSSVSEVEFIQFKPEFLYQLERRTSNIQCPIMNVVRLRRPFKIQIQREGF